MDLELIGRPDSIPPGEVVMCHTDLTSCCNRNQGVHCGDRYFPNGVRLLFLTDGDGVYEQCEQQQVDIRRRNNESLAPSGIA